MRQIKIPAPAIIVSALLGFALGISFEFADSYQRFPQFLLLFLVPVVLAGTILQLILWFVASRRKRVIIANLENLPTGVKDLLELVIKNMQYRKTVRQEVAAELAGHFEDELEKRGATARPLPGHPGR